MYDRNGFRILLHFSQTGAPGHPDVQVLLLTMMSTATQPVWDVMFQVAVPKVSDLLLASSDLFTATRFCTFAETLLVRCERQMRQTLHSDWLDIKLWISAAYLPGYSCVFDFKIL